MPLARTVLLQLLRTLIVTLANFNNQWMMAEAWEWNNDLMQRATSVRRIISRFPRPEELAFSSAYRKPEGTPAGPGMRGHCNWLIPQRVMVGQYPGENPSPISPNGEDVRAHLHALIHEAGVNMFCSLQAELPAQTSYDAWGEKGEIYLDKDKIQKYPQPFSHYAPIARSFLPECRFLHLPMNDLAVPSATSLQDILLALLTVMEDEQCILYLHCWGGRGRVGLVGACLLSMLFPEQDALTILDLVQAGYDTRAGAKEMPLKLSKSPETESQRDFVSSFVLKRQRYHLFQRGEWVMIY